MSISGYNSSSTEAVYGLQQQQMLGFTRCLSCGQTFQLGLPHTCAIGTALLSETRLREIITEVVINLIPVLLRQHDDYRRTLAVMRKSQRVAEEEEGGDDE